MKLFKKIICLMLVLAMTFCNDAVITFAESCSGTGTGTEADTSIGTEPEACQDEEDSAAAEPDEEPLAEEETEEEESVSAYDSRERENAVSKAKWDFTYKKVGNGISILKYWGSDTEVVIPEKIDGYPVVDIFNRAFQYKKSIETVVIPDTVEGIGSRAFEYCTNLTDIIFSDKMRYIGDYAFKNCEKLQTINLPEKLESIREYAFLNCTQLQTINFPERLLSIGNNVFTNCEKLQTIDLPKGLLYTGSDVFSGSALTELIFHQALVEGKYVLRGSNVEKVTFEDGITKIPDYICGGAQYLKNVELPETVTTIGAGAFRNCSILETVYIPNTVTVIASGVFTGCSALETIVLPEGLKTIGANCFSSSGITSMKIPSTLTEGASAFAGSNLVTAEISSGMEKIPGGLFQYAKKLKTVTIPDSVNDIGAFAFAYADSITDITLSADLTAIRERAFLGCSKLERLVIPSKVTWLGNSMLEKTAVKEIMVPASVTSASCPFLGSKIEKVTAESGMTKLPDGVFAGMKFLSEVVLPDTLTEIGSSAFSNTSLSEIHLPRGVTEIGSQAFKNAQSLQNWNCRTE